VGGWVRGCVREWAGKAYWDKASKQLISKRKRRLEEYILALASHKAVSRDDLYMSFLQFPDDLYSPPDGAAVDGVPASLALCAAMSKACI